MDSCTLDMRAGLAALEPSYHELDRLSAGS